MSKRHLILDAAILPTDFDLRGEVLSSITEFCQRRDVELRLVTVSSDDASATLSCSDLTSTHSALASEACECRQSGCVRNLVLSSYENDAYIIVVLSEPSLCCLANYADLIFARGQSLKYCNEQKLPHHPFMYWSDCARIIATSPSVVTMSDRRQARLQRMEAIKTE